MKMREYHLDKGHGRRIRSLGQCIYCGLIPSHPAKLTDEHVVPFAISANSIIFRGASCEGCARIIQHYEQEVLLKQLGNFRRKIDAPSRTKKNKRKTHADVSFKEVDDRGVDVRQLGQRAILICELPLALSLWQLPEPRIMRTNVTLDDDVGSIWYHCNDDCAVQNICRKVAEETGSRNVAIEIGTVNRTHFLRFLAKTAHAYATAELGINAFSSTLIDIILNRDQDISKYVGGYYGPRPPGDAPENLMTAHIGQATEGPGKGLVTVVLQFYPLLKTPIYSIIVGRPTIDIDNRSFDLGYDVNT